MFLIRSQLPLPKGFDLGTSIFVTLKNVQVLSVEVLLEIIVILIESIVRKVRYFYFYWIPSPILTSLMTTNCRNLLFCRISRLTFILTTTNGCHQKVCLKNNNFHFRSTYFFHEFFNPYGSLVIIVELPELPWRLPNLASSPERPLYLLLYFVEAWKPSLWRNNI